MSTFGSPEIKQRLRKAGERYAQTGVFSAVSSNPLSAILPPLRFITKPRLSTREFVPYRGMTSADTDHNRRERVNMLFHKHVLMKLIPCGNRPVPNPLHWKTTMWLWNTFRIHSLQKICTFSCCTYIIYVYVCIWDLSLIWFYTARLCACTINEINHLCASPCLEGFTLKPAWGNGDKSLGKCLCEYISTILQLYISQFREYFQRKTKHH